MASLQHMAPLEHGYPLEQLGGTFGETLGGFQKHCQTPKSQPNISISTKPKLQNLDQT